MNNSVRDAVISIVLNRDVPGSSSGAREVACQYLAPYVLVQIDIGGDRMNSLTPTSLGF